MIAPNPYATPNQDRPAQKPSMAGASFSHQGAVFSVLAPMGVVLLNAVVWAITGWRGGTGAYLQALLSCTGLMVVAVSFALAVIGLFGGFLQGSARTVGFALAGLAISLAGIMAVLFVAS